MHAPWCNLSSRGSCLALQQPYALSTAKIWWENNRHCLWKYWKFGTPEQQAASLNAVRDTNRGIFLIVVVGIWFAISVVDPCTCTYGGKNTYMSASAQNFTFLSWKNLEAGL